MNGVREKLSWLVFVLSTSASVARAMPPGEDGLALRAAAHALHASNPEAAATSLDRLAAAYPQDSDVAFSRALYRYLRGDYAGAVTDADRAIAANPHAADLAERRDLRATFDATREATAGYAETRSADGRFIVRYPTADAVLAPYALDTLARADRAATEVLGTTLPSPVRLEIYPTPEALSRVSQLTVEDIERTGTVALCKWNRLMVTSPRALVHGYPWADTIGHEYVHLVLTRAAADEAPVWLQEGTAKLLERRWRGDAGPLVATMSPESRALLDAAVRGDRLLPFERLHPSIALLPTAEDAALAFAQVSTFVEVYVARHGLPVFRSAIADVAHGTDAREALGHAAHTPFPSLEAEWKSEITERARLDALATAHPGAAAGVPVAATTPPMHFRHGDGAADDSLDVHDESARRSLRLGDLLWARHRPSAASLEYANAAITAPDDPIVASRLAHAALAAGQAERALATLQRAVARDPESEPVQALLGAALHATGDDVHAREHLVEALRINPFDPAPHCDLADLAADDATRTRETAFCHHLGGRAR